MELIMHLYLLPLTLLSLFFTETIATKSELRRLITLSRHGSRAPNDITETICPGNRANLESYQVPFAQLTQVGMAQMHDVGRHIRDHYVADRPDLTSDTLLPPTFDGPNHTHFEVYFRSDAEDRCAQSAAACGQGLYPDGVGPPGFPSVPVPVTMQLLQNEHDFAAPKGPCRGTRDADLEVYAKTRGEELLKEYSDVIDRVMARCGVDLDAVPKLDPSEDKVLAIKDIADMFIFDEDEGLPLMPGLASSDRDDIIQLAFTNLMERYYSTDRMVTYWAGGFPTLLLAGLNGAATPDSPSDLDYRYLSYHGHREIIHAIGKMIGMEFGFDHQPSALNTSSLHPGTTVFFELHATETEEKYFVRTFVWSPRSDREQVHLSKCSELDCPLEEFNSIITKHIQRTGTWQQICNYNSGQEHQKTTAEGVHVTSSASSNVIMHYVLITIAAVVVIIALIYALMWKRARDMRRHSYNSI